MFCVSCGSKLPDGAKFCSKCGTNLATYQNEKPNSMIYEEDDEKMKERIKRGVITQIFEEIFDDPWRYGNQVYIIGKDPIKNKKIKENLEAKYLEDRYERPLLIFDYRKHLEEGFVITDHRLIWHYGSTSNCAIELEDIMECPVGKAVLATVMRPVDFDNVQYPNIFLDGITEKETFAAKFNRFIDEIYDVFYGEGDEEQGSGNKRDEIEGLIIDACHAVNISTAYCVVGNPIVDESSRKCALARMNFNIPKKDNVYLIYDSTVLGGCGKGFALCTSGFYYCESKKGFLDWNQFAKQNITHGFGGLKIAGELFATGTDGKKLLLILKTIAEKLR